MSGKVLVNIEGAYSHKPAKEITTKSGKLMAKFSVSTSDDKKIGDKWERGPSKWWNCIAFDTNAKKALELLTGGVRGVCVEGRLTVEEYNGGNYEKVIVDHLSVAGSKPSEPSAHEKSKANGYQPEQIVREPEASEGEDDADLCPF